MCNWPIGMWMRLLIKFHNKYETHLETAVLSKPSGEAHNATTLPPPSLFLCPVLFFFNCYAPSIIGTSCFHSCISSCDVCNMWGFFLGPSLCLMSHSLNLISKVQSIMEYTRGSLPLSDPVSLTGTHIHPHFCIIR